MPHSHTTEYSVRKFDTGKLVLPKHCEFCSPERNPVLKETIFIDFTKINKERDLTLIFENARYLSSHEKDLGRQRSTLQAL